MAVAAMPAGWFGGAAQPILRQYCCYVARKDHIERLIKEAWKAPEDLKRLRVLTEMARKEGQAACIAARALRITPQAGLHMGHAHKAVSQAPKLERPWDAKEAEASAAN